MPNPLDDAGPDPACQPASKTDPFPACKVEHAKNVAPLLRGGPATDKVLAEAAALSERQQAAKRAGEVLLRPADVVRVLQRSAVTRQVLTRNSPVETLLSSAERPMLKVTRQRAGGLTIDVLPRSGADVNEMLKAIEGLLTQRTIAKSKG